MNRNSGITPQPVPRYSWVTSAQKLTYIKFYKIFWDRKVHRKNINHACTSLDIFGKIVFCKLDDCK